VGSDALPNPELWRNDNEQHNFYQCRSDLQHDHKSCPTDGKKYPVIFLIHGNACLVAPFGDQIHGFAKDLADRGYLTAVPQYYTDNNSHFEDTTPHNQILADAIEAVAARQDADLDRLCLIGFSLGATTAMTYIASKPQGTVKVLADFFGFLTPTIEAGVAKFPPTIILHNENDQIVYISYSKKLDKLLEKANIEHPFKVYDEHWKMMYDGNLVEVSHSFKPGDPADVDSRAQATDWFDKHLSPIGN
jgi:dienelactone hydrolase